MFIKEKWEVGSKIFECLIWVWGSIRESLGISYKDKRRFTRKFPFSFLFNYLGVYKKLELSLRKYTNIPEEDNGGQSGAEMCTKCVFLEHIRAFAAGPV